MSGTELPSHIFSYFRGDIEILSTRYYETFTFLYAIEIAEYIYIYTYIHTYIIHTYIHTYIIKRM
jgi:hypothetical protein